MNTARKCLDVNKLSLNIMKNEVMVFSHPCNNTFAGQVLNVPFDNSPVEHVSTFKYLSLHLDNYLSFNEHCEKFCKHPEDRSFLAGS